MLGSLAPPILLTHPAAYNEGCSCRGYVKECAIASRLSPGHTIHVEQCVQSPGSHACPSFILLVVHHSYDTNKLCTMRVRAAGLQKAADRVELGQA